MSDQAKQQSRFGRAFLWNHAGRILEYILTWAFGVLIARTLGAAGNGMYAVVLSTVQILLAVSSLGLEPAIIAHYAKAFRGLPVGSSGGMFRKLAAARIITSLLAGAAFLLLRSLLVSSGLIPGILADLGLLLAVYLLFRSVTALFTAFQIALVSTARAAFINVSVRALELFGAWYLLRAGYGLEAIFALIAGTAALQSFLYIALTPGMIRGGNAPAELAPLFRLGRAFWLNGMMEFILGRQADMLLLSFFLISPALIGHYDVASSFAAVLNTGITTGLYGLLVRSFSQLSEQDPNALAPYWEFVTRGIIIIVVPAFVFAGVFAGVIIPAIYSPAYLPSVPYFQVLALVFIVTRFLGGGVAADYLQGTGNTRALLISSFWSGATNIVLAIILIPAFGAMGAVIATGAADLVIVGLHAAYTFRNIPARIPAGTAIISLACAFIATYMLVVVIVPESILSIILAGVIYGTLILALFYVVKPLSESDSRFIRSIPPPFRTLLEHFVRLDGVFHTAGRRVVLTDRQKFAASWFPQSGTVVDIGSSISDLPVALHGRFGQLTAVEPDAESLALLARANPNILCKQGSAESLPFADAAVDTALMLDVLEHTHDDGKAVSELARVVKHGGTLILSVPNRGMFGWLDPQNLAAKAKGTFTRGKAHRHYSLDELSTMLGEQFSIIRVHRGGLFLYPVSFYLAHAFKKYLSLDLSRFLRFLGDIDNDISWGPLSYNLIIMAVRNER